MAAPVIQEEISIGEQSEVSIPDFSIQSSNLLANLTPSAYPKPLRIIIECLKSSILFKALTIQRQIPKRLVNLAFSKARYDKEKDIISFAVICRKTLSISKKSFIRLLGLHSSGTFVTSTAKELIGMFNQMGSTPMLTKISQFKKNKLPFIWNFFFTIFKRCLCGRRSGLDYANQLFLSALYGIYHDVRVDYGSILWYEFTESVKISSSRTELSSHRFSSVIVDSAYNVHKIPFDAAEEPKMIFHVFQAPSKIPIQPEFEFVGQIPVSMIGRIPLNSEILMAFKSKTSQNFPLRVIPEAILNEIQTQNVKVSLKRKDVGESSEIEVAKPKKMKKSKLRKLVLVDESEENEEEQQIKKIEGMEENVFKEIAIVNMDDDVAEADIEAVNETEAEQQIVQHEDQFGGNIENMTAEDEEEFESQNVLAGNDESLNPEINTEIEEIVGAMATEENFAETEKEGEQTVSDIVTTVVQSINQQESKFVNDNVELEIAAPSTTTLVGESLKTSETESSIFKDLTHLNVSIPLDSPQIPPVTDDAPILENIGDGNFIGLSDDEEFELAPIPENDDDMDDDTNDDQFISMKQFKILNQKLNVLIRFQDLPKEKELQKDTEIESVVLNFHEKLEAQSQVIQKLVDEFSDFKKIMNTDVGKLKEVCEEMKTSIQQLDNTEVKDECADIKDKIQNLEVQNVQGDEQFKILLEEILHLQGQYENELQKKLDEATNREEKLQKIVDDSLKHIKVLEESIKTYDEKEIAEEYNEKVVKHVEMVQQDFIARLTPLINFVKRIPNPKEGTSAVSVPKPFRKIDLPLFKNTVETSFPTYFNPTTTAEPQTIVQALTYPMLTQQQPEAVIRALDAARRLSKGVVIGSSIPLMTTSTIVSTIGEGSSITGSGKGKQAVIELSKEEQKQNEAEKIEKMKQQMSLIRQGESAEILGKIGESKIWTEATIRDVAFGEGEFFNMLPKASYEADLSSTQQLDLPLIPKLFKIKCFMVKASLQLLSDAYEEKLIRFYGSVGKPETEVWNSKPIVKVLKITNAGVFDGVFENKSFKVLRTDNKEYDFTMADFPTMNPSDLIRLFKLFNSVEKVDVIVFVLHLKKLLKAYVETFAEKDMLVSKEFFVKLDKPDIHLSGISKEKDGKIIHKPEWGVVSSARVKGKIVKSFLRMNEKCLFDNEVLESILRRIHQNDENTVKEKRDVEDQLRWWLKVRKEMLDLITVLYAKGR